jgi:hypothetical protein
MGRLQRAIGRTKNQTKPNIWEKLMLYASMLKLFKFLYTECIRKGYVGSLNLREDGRPESINMVPISELEYYEEITKKK